jgi:hypothetical protein
MFVLPRAIIHISSKVTWEKEEDVRKKADPLCWMKHVTARSRAPRQTSPSPRSSRALVPSASHRIALRLPFPLILALHSTLRLFVLGCSNCGTTTALGAIERMEQYFQTRASIDDDPDLARNRRANDARLKSRFEHIFAKYGKDFDGVGDEIDLETGRIIVNNGHIERMQHEVDPGKVGASQVLRVLDRGLQGDGQGIVHDDGFVVEDSTEELDDIEELGLTGTSGYSSSEVSDDNEEEGQYGIRARAPDELSSDFYDGTPEMPRRSVPASIVRKSVGRRQLNNDQANIKVHTTLRSRSPENAPMDLPFLRESMKAMQVPSGQRGSIDPDAIQALGQSIANQLAKYMTGDSTKSRRKSSDQRTSKDPRWEYPMLPGDRVDRTPTPPSQASASAALFDTSPGREHSIWAPERRSRQRQSKLQRQVFYSAAVDDDDETNVDPLQSDPPFYADADIGDETDGLRDIDCYNCGVTESRVWRVGPAGRLCDSCGTYHRRYGLLKAVEGPSSTPAPRPRPNHFGVPNRHHPTNKDTDVYAIPSTDAPDTTAWYASNTARRIHGDGRKARFSLEEEEAIIRLHEIDHISWDRIGCLVPHGTAHSVHSHYQKYLKAPGCEARQRLFDQSTHAPSFLPRPIASAPHKDITNSTGEHNGDTANVTETEDELIVRLRDHEGLTWAQISNFIPGRTSLALQTHYNEIKHGSSLSDFGPVDPALLAQDGQQILNDGFWQSSIDQTNHNLSTANSGPSIPDRLDLDSMDGELVSDKSRNYLHDRSIFLNAALRPHFVNDRSVVTNRMPDESDVVSTGASAIGRAHRQSSDRHALHENARTRMLPPSVPGRVPSRPISVYARTALSSGQQVCKDVESGAGEDHAQLPRTPSFHIQPASVPPRPLEVGPSAWAITQPASKGPIPFVPARKGLAPIRPKSAARELQDPFISRAAPTGAPTLSPDNGAHNDSGATPSIQEQLPRAAESSRGQNNATPEATKNAVQWSDGLPLPESRFTPEQDRFIKNARENRNLTWAAITEALPGDTQHTASAITHRYYDFLLGRNVATSAQEPHGAANAREPDDEQKQVSTRGRKHYSEEESDLIFQYKEQKMSWDEIAVQIPGRSPRSIQNHHFYRSTKGEREQTPSNASKQVRVRRSLKPLLRQALKNSTRRNSDVTKIGTHPTGPLQQIQTSRASPEIPVYDEYERTSPAIIPIEDELPGHSTTVSESHEDQPHSHPEVVIRSGECEELEADAGSCINQLEPHSGNLFESSKSHPPHTHNELQDAARATPAKRPMGRPRKITVITNDAEVADSDTTAKRPVGGPKRNTVITNDAEVADSDSDTLRSGNLRKKADHITQSTPAKNSVERRRIGLPPGLLPQNQLHAPIGTWTVPAAVLETSTSIPELTLHGDQDMREVEFQHWSQVLLAAFRSHPAGEVLRCRDVTNWVKKHNLFYLSTEDPWIHHVYNEVHRNPAFWKARYRNKGSAPGHILVENRWRKKAEGQILAETDVRPMSAGRTDDDVVTPADNIESDNHTTSAGVVVDVVGGEDNAGSNSRAASAGRTDEVVRIEGDIEDNVETANHVGDQSMDASLVLDPAVTLANTADLDNMDNHDNTIGQPMDEPPLIQPARPVHTIINIEDDELNSSLPTNAAPSLQLTDTSVNAPEIITISSNSPVKQEPTPKDNATSPYARRSTKRPLDALQSTPRAKRLRQSDSALIRRVSALATPARSGSGILNLRAQSVKSERFEPLFVGGARASPVIVVGPSGRRFVVATGVAGDDGDEQDELS